VTVEFIGIPSPSQVSILSPSSKTAVEPIFTKELPDVALGFPVPIGSVILNRGTVATMGAVSGGVGFLTIGPECFPAGGALSPAFKALLLVFSATGLPAIFTKPRLAAMCNAVARVTPPHAPEQFTASAAEIPFWRQLGD